MTGTDRISELHDSILTHILSYLPTKEAVQTRRLSKRWRNVWAFVPILDFDNGNFSTDDIFISRPYTAYVQTKFVEFIDAVLASRQVQLVDRFSLVWEYQANYVHSQSHVLRRWIHHVVQQFPRVLSLYILPRFGRIDMPNLIFTCSSLEEMTLQVHKEWPEAFNPILVDLPHLRKLNLGHATIKADFIDKLLLGCPSLEELELYACCLLISQISCGNLKSLVINGCYHSTEIEVSIPSLQYLKVTVMSSQTSGYVFKNMSSLVKASICLLAMNDYEMLIFNSEAKIIEGLLGVTALDIVLCGLDATHMLKHILKTCPYFENLKFMHFESFNGCMADCIDMVDCLAQHSPALKEFTFYRCQDDADDKIELVEKLREVLGEYGIVRLVERHQGHIYGSLGELKKLLHDYMKVFEIIEAVDDDEDEAEGVLLEDEEEDEGEGSSAEEEEGDEADEYVGGAMEEGEEMEENLQGEDGDEEE